MLIDLPHHSVRREVTAQFGLDCPQVGGFASRPIAKDKKITDVVGRIAEMSEQDIESGPGRLSTQRLVPRVGLSLYSADGIIQGQVWKTTALVVDLGQLSPIMH